MYRQLVEYINSAIRKHGATGATTVSHGGGVTKMVTTPDGMVLLHFRSGLMFTLNTTAARIWQGLCEDRPPGSIAASLALEFGVPETLAQRDIVQFVDSLQAMGLARKEAGA